jgi:ABC-type methionine transport system ATPase subunit
LSGDCLILILIKGYETLLGDKGALISGGQKQRLAIARALINHPSILLLDEATSALDNDSQQAIQTTLEAASVGRTTLIVAHRLVTVKNAHLIIYMKDGQVLERGTHKQLLDKKGAYFSLYQRQNSGNAGKGSASSSTGSSVASSEVLAQPTASIHEDDDISVSNVSVIKTYHSLLMYAHSNFDDFF